MSASTWATTSASAAASLICASPRSATTPPADPPVSNITSNTSRAVDVLMVSFPNSVSNSASPCGLMRTASISTPLSFIRRKRSPMIQLVTVLAWG